MFINFLLATVFFYFAKTPITPKTNLLVDVVIFTVLFSFSRIFLVSFLSLKTPTLKTVFVGSNDQLKKLLVYTRLNPESGYKIVAAAQVSSSSIQPIKQINNIEEIPSYISQHKIRAIISGLKETEHQKLIENLYKCLPLKIEFLSLGSFYETTTNKVPLDVIDEFWFIENLAKGQKKDMYDIVKRIFDIISSFAIFVLFLPFIPFIALVIKLETHGPVFFKQKRVGKNNKEFTTIKFRSMIFDAENKGPTWAKRNDPRVTKFGRFLRMVHLDEIPQLLNILKGDMSFVGPRPERPEFIKTLEQKIPYYSVRHLIKPGITGWAQIMFPYGSSVKDAKEKLQYELYYIKNRSFILDLKIILKTIYAVFKGDGR